MSTCEKNLANLVKLYHGTSTTGCDGDLMKISTRPELLPFSGTAVVRVTWQVEGMAEDPPGLVAQQVARVLEALSSEGNSLLAGRKVHVMDIETVYTALDDRTSHCETVDPKMVEEYLSSEYPKAEAVNRLINIFGEDAFLAALGGRGYVIDVEDT